MRVCIVSSCGGHLTEVRSLLPCYRKYNYYYVLNKRVVLSDEMVGKTHFISHSERDWKLFVNLFQAFIILKRNTPAVIISCGAGPIVPFALIGRLIFRAKIIYIETAAQIREPSLTGRIMKYLAHHLYYQWPSLEPFFPDGKYLGLID